MVVEQDIVEGKIVEPDTYYDCLNLSNSWKNSDTVQDARIVLDKDYSRFGLQDSGSHKFWFERGVDGRDSFLFFSSRMGSVGADNHEKAPVLVFYQNDCQPNGSGSCCVVWKHSQK